MDPLALHFFEFFLLIFLLQFVVPPICTSILKDKNKNKSFYWTAFSLIAAISSIVIFLVLNKFISMIHIYVFENLSSLANIKNPLERLETISSFTVVMGIGLSLVISSIIFEKKYKKIFYSIITIINSILISYISNYLLVFLFNSL